MRVAIVSRSDVGSVAGGDQVMVRNIAACGQDVGIEFEFVSLVDLTRSRYDLIHLTQVYQANMAKKVLSRAQSLGVPLVVSPLFEDVLPLWFRFAVREQRKWNLVSKILGIRLAEWLYLGWQRPRRRLRAEWRVQRDVLRNAYVLVNSLYEQQHLANWFGVSDLRFFKVPLGIDPTVYGPVSPLNPRDISQRLGLPVEKFVLQVGVISRRKNQDGLIRALDDTAVNVVFLGKPSPYEPEYSVEVRQLADQRGNTIFVERVEQSVLSTLYHLASVHILPSWSERPGLVSLEAAACGCKVISSNRTPIEEYLGELAWYCDPARPRTIRQAVEIALYADTPLGLSDYVRQRFTWAQTARRLARAYDEILDAWTN